MTALTDLRQALVDLLAIAAAGGAAADGESLSDRIARLDRLREEVGDQAPPMLRHYLERRSYEKALAFLEGRDPDEKPDR